MTVASVREVAVAMVKVVACSGSEGVVGWFEGGGGSVVWQRWEWRSDEGSRLMKMMVWCHGCGGGAAAVVEKSGVENG
nr:hypothetical protein [Tanacetum cinerariifolium]